MDKALTKKLVLNFPKLYRNCKYFDCGDGWFGIVWRLSEKLYPLLDENSYETCENYVTQVKEKYGTLRFYLSCETDEMSDLIKKAEEESSVTCEVCGDPGTTNKQLGWLSTVCKKHKID